MSDNTHPMCTRSKKKGSPPDDTDDKGNLLNFIDYGCKDEFNREELDKQIMRLRRGQSNFSDKLKEKIKRKHKKKSKIKVEEVNDDLSDDLSDEAYDYETGKQKKVSKLNVNNQNDLGGLLMTYILAKANDQIKRKPKKKKKKIIEINLSDTESGIDVSSDSDINSEDFEDTLTEKTTTTEDSDITLDEDSEDSEESVIDSLMNIELDENEELSDEESEYDELDTAYSELVDEYAMDNTEDGNLDYFHSLDKETKIKYLKDIRKVYKTNSANVPLKFKVLNSDMDIYTKSIAISNLDKLAEMDISTGEYNKMDQWINGLIKLPFSKNTPLPVSNDDDFDKKREYIKQTLDNMNKAIYGHLEAKTHILQVIGKWIRNPDSLGNVLAIQGPMGNGKTTLIKNGIAKSLNRPFEFVALGGASDSAFFEGHSYTYEGSRWGRIVDILHKCGSMNPIICFDELDKVSETVKGDEIINMLIHMTDSSQNSKFQDNYFPGIDIDLSKVLFIFSFNDESKINRILKDRMYVIRTKGYDNKDKLQIAHNYLLPDILSTFNYTNSDIIFTDEILTEIIKTYTGGEEGVRNLKRCIENIISTLNIYHLTKSDDKEDILDMKIKDFKLPITLTKEHINSLLKVTNSDKPPEHMYL
jgi:ATP-dependent Lon protease